MAATNVTATFTSTVPVVETLVSGLMYGFDVAPSADGYVYYTSQGGYMMMNGTVGRVLKGGGGQVNLASGQTNPFDMVQGGSGVFWDDARDNNIKRVATTGGTPVVIARAASQFATDGTDVYWTENDKIARVPASGTSPITDVVTALTSPYGLIVDATNIYWVERGATTCTFKRRPKAGGTIVTLASNVPNADRVAFDGTHIYAVVYATSGNNGSIIRVPAAGGAYQVVAANQSPFDVAVDGNHVYWTNWLSAPTGVFRCTKVAGCTPEMVESGSPNNVALDSTHIYWSEFASIKRRGK
jgi:streptogramin lyase